VQPDQRSNRRSCVWVSLSISSSCLFGPSTDSKTRRGAAVNPLGARSARRARDSRVGPRLYMRVCGTNASASRPSLDSPQTKTRPLQRWTESPPRGFTCVRSWVFTRLRTHVHTLRYTRTGSRIGPASSHPTPLSARFSGPRGYKKIIY